jgi:cytochrome c oxidase subunit II
MSALAGCRREGAQSALAPIGPDAARIAEFSWALFAGGGLIFLAVLVFVFVAAAGGERQRRVLASRRFILAAGVAFPVAVLSALLAWTLGLSRALDAAPSQELPLRIEIIGHQYWWEVRYPDALADSGNGGGGDDVVTANEVRIPVGREVEMRVSSSDVIHSVWIPALHGKIDMIPGQVNTLRLRADRAGVVRGQCAEFCGAQHALMAFFVVAEAPEAFERWLARQRLPVEEPDDALLALGWRAFGAAGCGACHTVRGTEWTGRLGPDLTRVGSRLSLAAASLDNHRGTLAAWVAGAQDLKPGSRMPSFRAALDGEELRAVAAWLESLK